ncbi:teichoic acid D-Ala incorporation-associated protein DltX [Ligilactobacillus sp. WC1T17]
MMKHLKDNIYLSFILKTIFYFGILFALLYLYSYSGINQPHFIYNEF